MFIETSQNKLLVLLKNDYKLPCQIRKLSDYNSCSQVFKKLRIKPIF